MVAGEYDITIEQGATFSCTLTWNDETGDPVNLTGFTGRLHARRTSYHETKLLDLTTENGGITLGGAAGTITILASATLTASIDAPFGVYDLELVAAGGHVTRLIRGKIDFIPEVTR